MTKHAQVTDITPAKKPLPMALAQGIFAALCHRVDDGATIDEAIQAEFTEARLDLVEAIDRRKAVAIKLKNEAAAAADMARAYSAFAKRLNEKLDSLKRHTLELILREPDLPYRTSSGEKLYPQKSPPSLRTALDGDLRDKVVTHVVDLEAAERAGIPLTYLEPVTYYRLNTEKLKADLQAGHVLPFAHLEQGTHLRGL